MKRILAVAGALLLSMGFLAGCADLGRILTGGSGGGGKGPSDCAASNGVCKVDVTVPAGCTSGGCVVIQPDPVVVGDGTRTAKDVHLLWKLPQGYAFCSNDGVIFKGDTYDQFSDNYATGGSSGGGSPNYHWKDANTHKGPGGGPFPYRLVFHDKDCKTLYDKDPGVVNEM